jgi:hypothetical protein
MPAFTVITHNNVAFGWWIKFRVSLDLVFHVFPYPSYVIVIFRTLGHRPGQTSIPWLLDDEWDVRGRFALPRSHACEGYDEHGLSKEQ